MKFHPNQIYHVFNRGNNRQKIFLEHDNYLYFLGKVRQFILPYADILCYCLMPNHFHILLVPNQYASQLSTAVKPRKRYERPQASNIILKPTTRYHLDHQENLSKAIGTLLSSYTKAINKRYHRSGSLFKGRTKVKDGWIDGPITLDGPNKHLFFRADNDYGRRCFEYIHNNPVRAHLVKNQMDWMYSSARDYAGLRKGTLCNQDLAQVSLFL